MERIERIVPINPVEHDVRRAFERGNGNGNENAKKNSFAKKFQATKEEAKKEELSEMPVPYELDLTRATQSFFYNRQIDLSRIGALLDER